MYYLARRTARDNWGRRGNARKGYGLAMPKPISIGMASESTPIQCPHLCAFVTFIVSIVSMTSKLTFLYSCATVLALYFLITEVSCRILCYGIFGIFYFYYGSPVAPNNGIGSRQEKGYHIICHSGPLANIQYSAISSWAFIVFNQFLAVRLYCSDYFALSLCCEIYENVLLRRVQNKLVTKPGMWLFLNWKSS